MILKIRRKFAAAHKLPNYKGDCAALHGHTWQVVFEVQGEVGASGMVCDFKELKPLLDALLPDHKFLNDLLPNPTAENLCQYLFDKAAGALKERGLKLLTLEVWENEDAAALIKT
ncbi:MAG: 6-carboxytetrahydropterin synthase [Elusimicrobiota bacterium]|jgi:6-pyruvoyltetrahydropterin/6-carboxytetrahydropterin synthase|nr:6-carboxytetrahydropterin synthase [Elusimicrobiota bacterium]